MALLPLNLDVPQMQTRWKAILDVFIKNPLNAVNVLPGIELSIGVNVINHRLGRLQQGWFLTDINSAALIYRSEPFNDQTLVLTSDSIVTVNLGVF